MTYPQVTPEEIDRMQVRIAALEQIVRANQAELNQLKELVHLNTEKK